MPKLGLQVTESAMTIEAFSSLLPFCTTASTSYTWTLSPRRDYLTEFAHDLEEEEEWNKAIAELQSCDCEVCDVWIVFLVVGHVFSFVVRLQ